MRQGAGQFPDLAITIDAEFEQVWYLVADSRSWPGLMPHIHAVNLLDRHSDRTLLRIDARRCWLPVRFHCGIVAMQRDEGPEPAQTLSKGRPEASGRSGVVHRWYVSGPWRGTVETWHVQELNETVSVQVSITAPNPLSRLARSLIILPLARRTLAMIQILGEAHRDAHHDLG